MRPGYATLRVGLNHYRDHFLANTLAPTSVMRVLRRVGFTVRKTLWYFLIIGEPTNPRTHWRKWDELERWLDDE